MRIHIRKVSDNKQVFGSLNIGRLKETNMIHRSGNPVFLDGNNELVYCSREMFCRIEERLNELEKDYQK